jgi:intraflagellar transport protein 80
VEDAGCWAVLGALALEAQQWAAAEAAYAALDCTDRLQWVQALQRIPSAKGRAAEVAAFKGQSDAAEGMLLRVSMSGWAAIARFPTQSTPWSVLARCCPTAFHVARQPPLHPVQAGLLYRAVKLNMRLCRWERALNVAQRQSAHVDAVLLRRRRYLAAAGACETLPAFMKADTGQVLDEAAIKATARAELGRGLPGLAV